MDRKEKVVETAMQVILHAGNARNIIREIGNKIENRLYKGVEEQLEIANNEIIKAHKAQTHLLQEEAGGITVDMTVLFAHAQDTLMATESELFFVKTIYNIERNRKKWKS